MSTHLIFNQQSWLRYVWITLLNKKPLVTQLKTTHQMLFNLQEACPSAHPYDGKCKAIFSNKNVIFIRKDYRKFIKIVGRAVNVTLLWSQMVKAIVQGYYGGYFSFNIFFSVTLPSLSLYCKQSSRNNTEQVPWWPMDNWNGKKWGKKLTFVRNYFSDVTQCILTHRIILAGLADRGKICLKHSRLK